MITFFYLLPVFCALFVLNLVAIIKKIHAGDMNTGLNTFLATLGLSLIIIIPLVITS